MARIAGVDLPKAKRMEIALTYIYGVGRSTARKVLELAGMKDVWTDTKGDTRTVFNFAMATLNALRDIRRQKYQTGEKA